ncbi:MAG: penicillin-binding protein 2 [Phycisphaerae bacterium]|nr:penicillin-binding protein 2 [Phycisphaerae bacterium]
MGPATAQRTRVAQWAVYLICGALALLVGRLVHLRAKEAPFWQRYAQERQISTIPMPARRGFIFDRRFRVLAGSQDLPTVFADPRPMDDRAEVARALSGILEMPAREIRALLDEPTAPGYVVLKRSVDARVVEELKKAKIVGVGVQNEPVRTYPMGALASHVVGFVGKDGKGLEGIEKHFDAYLHATPGKRDVYRDVRRRAVLPVPDSSVAPRDGDSVVLAIDIAVQEMVEKAVAEQVTRFQAECGLGVAMNPKTGEVLAMTNYPTYAPSEGSDVHPERRRNRVLTDPVEPGSVFKPFVMVTALAEGVTTPGESIFCENGLYAVGARRLHDHHPYGFLTAAEVLAKSSNIGMAKLGERLGNQRMYEALYALGFGHPTGIDLPGEDKGLLMPLRKWDKFTTTSVPMGQEVAVTPMQIATAFCVLVNGGRLVQPRVVLAVIDREGRAVKDNSRVIDKGQKINPTAAETIRKLLVGVVTGGTGKPCDIAKWQLLGKTGTAQVPKIGTGRYEPDAYLGSFMAAAPASDPQVVVLVMVRKPKRSIGYYGATVALPAVKTIMEGVLPYLNVPPDKTEPQKQASLAGESQRKYN